MWPWSWLLDTDLGRTGPCVPCSDPRAPFATCIHAAPGLVETLVQAQSLRSVKWGTALCPAGIHTHQPEAFRSGPQVCPQDMDSSQGASSSRMEVGRSLFEAKFSGYAEHLQVAWTSWSRGPGSPISQPVVPLCPLKAWVRVGEVLTAPRNPRQALWYAGSVDQVWRHLLQAANPGTGRGRHQPAQLCWQDSPLGCSPSDHCPAIAGKPLPLPTMPETWGTRGWRQALRPAWGHAAAPGVLDTRWGAQPACKPGLCASLGASLPPTCEVGDTAPLPLVMRP